MKRAQEMAQSMESADKGAKNLKEDNTHHSTDSMNLTTLVKKAKPCYHCNSCPDPRQCKFSWLEVDGDDSALRVNSLNL